MRKRIIFITPNLGRTGSEMVLWYLLNNLDIKKYDIFVFCLSRGELYDNLPHTIKRTLAYRGSGKWYKKVFRGILKAIRIEPIGYQLKQIQQSFKADLWYANTILVPQAHKMANDLGVKIVTHFHEVQYAFSFIKSIEFENIIKFSDTLIACSELSLGILNAIAPNKTKLQNSFIDEKSISVDQTKVSLLKKKFGITADDFVWVISGNLAYMKGLNIINQIMASLKDDRIKIIWIGADLNTGLNNYIKNIISHKYANQLFFTGSISSEYYNYLSLADGLLMISSEESFSLVMVEAAYLGIPIVSFDTGIANRLIREDCGELVKNQDVEGLIISMRKQQVKTTINKIALRKGAIEYTVNKQLPNFEKLIGEIIMKD